MFKLFIRLRLGSILHLNMFTFEINVIGTELIKDYYDKTTVFMMNHEMIFSYNLC